MPRQENEPRTSKLYIELMGVPASGKTTFSGFLKEEFGMATLEEIPVDKIPRFGNYYEESETNPEVAFGTQIIFLFEGWSRDKGDANGRPGVSKLLETSGVVSEPSARANLLFAQARLGDYPQYYSWYKDFYDGLFLGDAIPKPDLLIYLRVNLESMIERIEKRAEGEPDRKPELKASKAYWERLWRLHEDWIRENPLGLKIVVLDVDKFDFTNYKSRKEAFRAMVEEIQEQSGVLLRQNV